MVVKTQKDQANRRELPLRKRAAYAGHIADRDLKLRAIKAEAILSEMTRLKGVLSATPSNLPTAHMLDKLKKDLETLTNISYAKRDLY